jgi:hypothetical protein
MKFLLFSIIINTGEIVALPYPEAIILSEVVSVEARKRNGKGKQGRRRGGRGLR